MSSLPGMSDPDDPCAIAKVHPLLVSPNTCLCRRAPLDTAGPVIGRV